VGNGDLENGQGAGMRDLLLVTLGVLFAMTFDFAFPKTYDEKKWERLQEHRENRRAIERKYESCVFECSKGCSK
jgi:hypothetical protein